MNGEISLKAAIGQKKSHYQTQNRYKNIESRFDGTKIGGERLPLARTPLLATPSPRGSAPKTPKKLTFIELFSGIGAFYQAITNIVPNAKCVFAADINKDCAKVYKLNYGIESLCDLTKIETNSIPDHDFCFFSPPCQAFSKGGKRLGFEETRGTLIFEVFRILKSKIERGKPPKYILMENVRNLVSHDKGNTIRVILKGLHELGYRTPELPLILSPHQFGIPQLRERAFLPGIYDPENVHIPLNFDMGRLLSKNDNNIFSIIDEKDFDKTLQIRKEDIRTIDAWNEFYHAIDLKVIGFPVWADYFHSDKDISHFPNWKKDFIHKNEELYKRNKDFIDNWAEKWKVFTEFTPTQRKFEWQCGTNIKDISEALIQFRPSGMRVKVPTVAPALVAMVQTPVLGKLKRKLSLKECLRLQSFPDDFNFGEQSLHECYKQLGNSICVTVVQEVTKKLLEKEI
ncbi:DNA (cytosine-5-)-methyltransferase [Fibrobacter sp.]|uniref:DNA (cytosine-5-)-methyltransferase n=1 Tax=Fibrobacter sp. TaxID=35828 RepID=UPI002626F40A|nr:DNA (cytosine-5-)-methyltransferase [Fibrobacter sp.]MDD5941789.1 DNA (cytosine-5-)-methyltransferase [Fibrobacter sp.]